MEYLINGLNNINLNNEVNIHNCDYEEQIVDNFKKYHIINIFKKLDKRK